MSRCRSCNAPVMWVETEATASKPGRKMPLDADPNTGRALKVDDGNITFTGGRSGDGTPIVRYQTPGHHRSHFATCANAASHRRGA